MFRFRISAFLLVFLSQFLFSQQYDFEKLDRYFDSLKENNRFMGTISLSKGNELIYTRSIGFLDFENNILLDSNSKFRIGSISKTFTSVLVLKSEEDGKLNLDDTIEKFFPDLPNSENITIENLLSHRSGVFNFTDSPEYIKYSIHPKSREELIKIISNFDPVFKPGRRSEYSNSNYILLTIILEKLYSKNYSDILSEKITKPYELNNTYYGDKVDIKNNEAKSYIYAGKWMPQDETDPSVPLGAGGIVSNPSDLAKFSYLLFSGKILMNQSLEKMKKINGQYGLGIFTIPFYKRTAFGHTGGIDGFSSIFAHFTDDEVSYVLNSNGTNFNNNDISIAVLSAVFDKPYEIPTFSSYDYLPKDLKELLGSYSSEEIPLIIEVTMEGSILMIQATGQPRISLEAVEKNNFKSDIVGVEIEFKPEKNSFILRQNGAKIKFVKNK